MFAKNLIRVVFVCTERINMKIHKIAELLNAEVLCGDDHLDNEVCSACGCDMMSDVLAFVKEQAVLITGLCNPQVVRTAEMMDMRCIVFVRGKIPPKEVIDLANELGIVILATAERMYVACGLLYANGLSGGTVVNE
jgi:predicted transcriptional regulator